MASQVLASVGLIKRLEQHVSVRPQVRWDDLPEWRRLYLAYRLTPRLLRFIADNLTPERIRNLSEESAGQLLPLLATIHSEFESTVKRVLTDKSISSLVLRHWARRVQHENTRVFAALIELLNRTEPGMLELVVAEASAIIQEHVEHDWTLPKVEMHWTENELEQFAQLSTSDPPEPTDRLRRILKP